MHIHPIPAFEDNYIWLLVDGNNAAVIDPGQADPVIDYLENHQLKLKAILLTHHHYDHIDGAQTLRERYACPVYGAKMHEIDTLAQSEGDSIDLSTDGLGRWQVMTTPGHTLDHLAYFSPSSPPVLFCGDTLFGAGCGKLFEGTAEQMQSSLQKIRALPDDTLIYCGHEYTEDNLRFATLAEPDNSAIHQRIASSRAQRAHNEPTLPSTLALEKATNPFLRWDDAELLAQAEHHVQHGLSTPAAIFAAVRAWKDAFDSQPQ
ncbi:MAG: hydroxyacylglutathione hydrolase [Gammaproteobacteria bacterium 28-57-27]|nr:MAG: hydroxyacylglutathione hydrolase [Gammaproteobacteria bacterium 28-57-27]